MGRIADALKRAESERAERIRLTRGSVRPAAVADAAAAAAGAAEGTTPPLVARRLRVLSDAAPPPPPARSAADPSVLVLSEPDSAVAEQFRAVRTWLLRHNAAGERRSYAITSSVAAEGKSVCTLNLAACLAEVRHLNVLAVDADLRQRRLAPMLAQSSAPGLAEVLSGEATLSDAIHATCLRNQWLMPAGNVTADNLSQLLSSRAAAAVFDELREQFHYVLVDSPAVQTASDVGVIGGLCSGVLMVIRMHRTPEPIVHQSVRWLQANNLNVVGCILTAANARRPRLGAALAASGPA